MCLLCPCDIVCLGNTIFEVSFHGRVDVDNQLGGVALWSGTSPIPVSVPLQFTTYNVNPYDGNNVAFNIYVTVDTTMGVSIHEYTSIATQGSYLTNGYGNVWIDWNDHMISWSLVEDNQVINSTSATSTSTSTSITLKQPSNVRFATDMTCTWFASNPYALQLTMDATSRSNVLTNVAISATIDTMQQVHHTTISLIHKCHLISISISHIISYDHILCYHKYHIVSYRLI